MNAWITPAAAPTGYACRCLLLPDDREWRAIFVGALLNLCDAEKWEVVDGISIADTLEVWITLIENFLDGADCEP